MRTHYPFPRRFAFSGHTQTAPGEESQGRIWASADLSTSHFQLGSHFLRIINISRKVDPNQWFFQPRSDLSAALERLWVRPCFATSAMLKFDRIDNLCNQKISAEWWLWSSAWPLVLMGMSKTPQALCCAEMGTVAWTGWLFVFPGFSWVVLNCPARSSTVLDGGEWEWAHFATRQGKLLLFHIVPSPFISVSWVIIKQDQSLSCSAEPAALSRIPGLCSPLAGGLESLDTSALGRNSPFLTCYWQPPKTETPWVTAMDKFHQLAVSN